MNRRDLFSSLALATTGLLAIQCNSALGDSARAGSAVEDAPEGDAVISSFSECADACFACAKQCGACFDHCTMLLQTGQKGYSMLIRTCIDCAEHVVSAALASL